MRLFAAFAISLLLAGCPVGPGIEDDEDGGVTTDAGLEQDAGVGEVDAGVPCEPIEPVDGECTLAEGDCTERTAEMSERIRLVFESAPRSCERDSDCTVFFLVHTCDNGAQLVRCPRPIAKDQECGLQAAVDQLLHEFCSACIDGACVDDGAVGSCGPAVAVCEDQRCRIP